MEVATCGSGNGVSAEGPALTAPEDSGALSKDTTPVEVCCNGLPAVPHHLVTRCENIDEDSGVPCDSNQLRYVRVSTEGNSAAPPRLAS